MASDIKASATAMLHHATGFQASQAVKRLSSMCECDTFGGNVLTPHKETHNAKGDWLLLACTDCLRRGNPEDTPNAAPSDLSLQHVQSKAAAG